uniref:Uncharacterized protein n=1 Tax=Anguilla anguilla TaxID=7936 RepID=A0A0E9XEE6_ANGAN
MPRSDHSAQQCSPFFQVNCT